MVFLYRCALVTKSKCVPKNTGYPNVFSVSALTLPGLQARSWQLAPIRNDFVRCPRSWQEIRSIAARQRKYTPYPAASSSCEFSKAEIDRTKVERKFWSYLLSPPFCTFVHQKLNVEPAINELNHQQVNH